MTHPLRRGAAVASSLAVAAAGISALGVGTAPVARAADVGVTDATFTWGLSGYAQKGIFGPWTYSDLTGNVTQLVGSVTTPPPAQPQTSYVVAPVPATSMPASSPQKTPNAVRFTLGTGTADPATGAATVAWDGSYTVNAYPAQFGAPDEIWSDPELTVAADGSGEVTMGYALGAGTDMTGNPVPAQDLGRITVMTFSAGSADQLGLDSYRYTPDYQGVEVTVPSGGTAQTRSCSTADGATGWWGAWSQDLVDTVPASVRPHFYSTGCGGLQDNKPPLPVDVDLGIATEPAITVSDTDLLPSGKVAVTVTGTGFDPTKAVGTRPPLAGRPAGVYVAFGKFAETWRPSQGAPSSSRKQVQGDVAWATPGGVAPGTTSIAPDGSFTATVQVDRAAVDALDPAFVGSYGIYVYPGSGAVEPSFEVAQPITFTRAAPTLTLSVPPVSYGRGSTATVRVTGETDATGTVTLTRGSTTVGSADLEAGTASFDLGRLRAGTQALTASYAGDVDTEPATTSALLRVARATTSTKVAITRLPAARRGGRATVAVTSPSTAVTGEVTAVLRRADGRVARRVTGALVRGARVVALPRLTTGRYRLVVTYAGTPDVAGSTRTARFRVR